ncbi:hypothetical protein [Streptomyces sp. NPDC058595]
MEEAECAVAALKGTVGATATLAALPSTVDRRPSTVDRRPSPGSWPPR